MIIFCCFPYRFFYFPKGEELDNAVDRARLALQVVQHLSIGEENSKEGEGSGSGDSDAATKGAVELIREFVQPIHVEEKELAGIKSRGKRKTTLRNFIESEIKKVWLLSFQV